jgi:hypothetical protein
VYKKAVDLLKNNPEYQKVAPRMSLAPQGQRIKLR